MKTFLSAVTSQFVHCRNALASDLRAVGAEVVVQEHFQQHGRTLLEKLEDYIASAIAYRTGRRRLLPRNLLPRSDEWPEKSPILDRERVIDTPQV